MTTEFLIALARPVRHEANNLLAAIGGTAEIMLRAARLRDATARLQALLHGYLALAAPPPEGTDAAAVIEALHPMVMLTLGPGSRVEIAIAAGLPPLATSPLELQAAALGLARRAAEGVLPGGGLRVSLVAAAGGAVLAVAPLPEGEAPPPLFLPAAAR